MGKKKKLKEDREYIKMHTSELVDRVEVMIKNKLYEGKPIIDSEEEERIKKEADDELGLMHFLFGARSTTRPSAGEGLRWQDESTGDFSPEFKKLYNDIEYKRKHKSVGDNLLVREKPKKEPEIKEVSDKEFQNDIVNFLSNEENFDLELPKKKKKPVNIKTIEGNTSMKRIDKANYYLDIADSVAERSTCLSKNYGAVIVKNDEIISTGYNGSPRRCVNCCDTGVCYRKEHNIPRGKDYTTCRSVHAEMNAIISASRDKMIGSTLYLSGKEYATGEYVRGAEPCPICKRLIINAGIEYVIVRIEKASYKSFKVSSWTEDDDAISGINGY